MPPQILGNTHSPHWRLGLIAAALVVIVTSIPQVSLIAKRGTAWQGSYAFVDFDELSYLAYLNALINGQPRQNNPYLGSQSDHQEIGESYFSIQCLPAYAIALPARVLRISTSTAAILVVRLMAFASSLSIFWLLFQFTRNEKRSAVGTLVVLLCGRLASESPFSPVQSYSSFAFLRFYLPAVPFPLFFLFCGFVWRAFVNKSSLWALGAGLTLALLIYSYFYLWTAAVAWLFCFTILWLIAKSGDWRDVMNCVLIVGCVSLSAFLPYLYLLSLRSKTIDEDQALTLSRAPDLFRVPEVISFVILLILILQIRRRRLNESSPETLFIGACALSSLIVFNQQVITGYYLQSFHYEQFIINYVVLLAVAATYYLIWPHLKIRPIIWAAFAVGVGITTAVKEAHDNSALNIRRDRARVIFEQLHKSEAGGFAVFDNSLLAASALTDSTTPQLWAPNMYVYGGISKEERVERFYEYLYLLGVEPQTFEQDLYKDPHIRATVFGLTRVNVGLSQNFMPVSDEELRASVEAYSNYVKSFSYPHASRRPLTHVITSIDLGHDFTNLDRWYIRSEGEQVEESIVYRVKLRSP